MTLKFATLTGFVIVLSACAAKGQLSQTGLERLSLCNAGHSQTLSADIQGKVAQDLHDGQLSATLASEIKGAFLNNNNLPEADRLAGYQMYIDCIKDIRT
jgi:hypothetical protein